MFNKLRFKQTFAKLVLLALSIQLVSFSVIGQSFKNARSEEVATEKQIDPIDEAPQSKIAPDLQEKLTTCFPGRIGDRSEKVIIRYKSDSSLNDMSGNDMSDKERVQMFAQEAESNQEIAGILVTDLISLGGELRNPTPRLEWQVLCFRCRRSGSFRRIRTSLMFRLICQSSLSEILQPQPVMTIQESGITVMPIRIRISMEVLGRWW